MKRAQREGWFVGVGSLPFAVGAVIGIVGVLAPFGLFAERDLSVLGGVDATLSLAAILAVIAVPVLIAITVNGADTDGLVWDFFLGRRGRAARWHLFLSAQRSWLLAVVFAVVVALVTAVASAIASSGVVRDLGSPAVLVRPALLLVGTTVYSAVIGLALALLVGNARLAIMIHLATLLLLPTLASWADDGVANRVAVLLPFAPWWSRLTEDDLGSVALTMSSGAALVSALAWVAISAAVIAFSMRRLDGLTIATWVKGG